jgi:hypothetical protein
MLGTRGRQRPDIAPGTSLQRDLIRNRDMVLCRCKAISDQLETAAIEAMLRLDAIVRQ